MVFHALGKVDVRSSVDIVVRAELSPGAQS